MGFEIKNMVVTSTVLELQRPNKLITEGENNHETIGDRSDRLHDTTAQKGSEEDKEVYSYDLLPKVLLAIGTVNFDRMRTNTYEVSVSTEPRKVVPETQQEDVVLVEFIGVGYGFITL